MPRESLFMTQSFPFTLPRGAPEPFRRRQTQGKMKSPRLQSHFCNKPDESAMNRPSEPVSVAILAFPETTAS
jgi:hypothetical protein